MNSIGLMATALAACVLAGCAKPHLASTIRPDRPLHPEIVVPTGPDDALEANGVHDVVMVGSNWDGTATIFDPHSFKVITWIDIVPDIADRLADINKSAKRRGLVRLNRRLAGEGHDQLVDDLFTSNDGRMLYVSRPSFGDVVAINMLTRKIEWRREVDGGRADHAAITRDGSTLLVSASTRRKVHVINTRDGSGDRSFPSGDEPHENNFSRDETTIFHASIGRVFLPVRSKLFLFRKLKGDRWFEIVDAQSLKVVRRIDMGQKLKEFGRNLEPAVRPMAVAPDERYVYLQISFLHGFVEYDLRQDRVTRIADLPVTDEIKRLPASRHQLNSAHHGIAINPSGTKLCVAGTMSGYAAIVHRDNFATQTIDVGEKPYWSTASANGENCYVSVSGKDRVSVISFDKETAIGSVDVGRHPQRVRSGKMYLGASAR